MGRFDKFTLTPFQPELRSADDVRRVTLTGRDVDDATRLLRILTLEDAGKTDPKPHSLSPRFALIETARELLRIRHRRIDVFGKAMFREPAWEILLNLYAEQDGVRFTIGKLAQKSGTPLTTALRWIDYLEKRRFVRRELNPTDARAFFVELTDAALSALDVFLSETAR